MESAVSLSSAAPASTAAAGAAARSPLRLGRVRTVDLNLRDPQPSGPLETLLAEIYVYREHKLLAKYAIEHGEYIIGRDASCHIVVDADQVSRHHARLTFSAFELIIEDLSSSNGVFIEGEEVQIPTRVRPDQEVQIGSARLCIRLKEESAQQLVDALWDEDLGLEPVRKLLSGQKYKVITTIARGGMGVVMQARDLRVRRTVAMKVMKTAAQFSRENVLRFVDEAQLTGQLEHPNIIPVYDLALDEQGEAFYTMKFVKGITLDEVLRGLRHGNERMVAKYPLGRLLTIFQKICDGVAFAHSKGVVHRDLKPENIMIGSYGEVLVMDWGLAKNLTGAKRGDTPSLNAQAESLPFADGRGFQTMHGLVVGTPPYISPEQARGELDKIDARSDIYVLGEILYAILTLRAPVPGSTVAEVIENILASRITPPTTYNTSAKSSRRGKASEPNPDEVPLLHCPARRIPESLSAVVMKAMQADPEKRYHSVEEMQEDVTAHQGGFATKAERAGWWKQATLWAARHKAEVALVATFALVFHVLVATFFLQLKHERDAAITSARRALESERIAGEALESLRGTAPTFASEAHGLIESLKFQEALEKIDYAIEQQPNHAEYYVLRGHALQSLLRFREAEESYEIAVGLDPAAAGATLNLEITRKLLATESSEAGPTPAQLRELQQSMREQGRVDEAFGMLSKISADRELFRRTVLDAFARLGLRERVETNDDSTISLDLSNVDLTKGLPGRGPNRRSIGTLRELRNRPISFLNLDGTRTVDLTVLAGWKLQKLSISNNPVLDLGPLSGMPLLSLSADGCPIRDLSPLTGRKLEVLRLRNTRVTNLQPLSGMPLEQLTLAGCRGLSDLRPLLGAPLQQLDLSRTAVNDLTPLIGSPIRELNLELCSDLYDLRPLMEMEQLEAVVLPAHLKDVAFLKEHPTLKRVSYKRLTEPAGQFWQEMESRKSQRK